MLTLEQIRDGLQDRKIAVVARDSGVSRQTIWRLCKPDKSASYSVLKKLSDYLEARP